MYGMLLINPLFWLWQYCVLDVCVSHISLLCTSNQKWLWAQSGLMLGCRFRIRFHFGKLRNPEWWPKPLRSSGWLLSSKSYLLGLTTLPWNTNDAAEPRIMSIDVLLSILPRLSCSMWRHDVTSRRVSVNRNHGTAKTARDAFRVKMTGIRPGFGSPRGIPPEPAS